MTRRCSHCSNNGHNSRTCPSRGGAAGGSGGAGLKLFGVRLTDGTMMKKSASMGNLSAHFHSSLSSMNPGSPSSDPIRDPVASGYLSDDTAHGSSNRRGERKKGVPWTEEEHRLFLIGLQKLGKGDWRGIARNYVTSRTPTQVASHAQKHFIRQTNASRRKRRSSLFDMSADVEVDPPTVPEEPELPPAIIETDNSDPMPSLNLSLNSKFELMDSSPQEPIKENEEAAVTPNSFPLFFPGYYQAPLPIAFPVWPAPVAPQEEEGSEEMAAPHHQVLKPIPLFPKNPVNVDALVGMSQLSLTETEARAREPSPLSLKLLGGTSRQSAFHVNAPASGSDLSTGKTSPIQAV